MADGAWMTHTQGNGAPVKTIKAITHARVQDVYGRVAIKIQPGHGRWYCWVGQPVSSESCVAVIQSDVSDDSVGNRLHGQSG